MLRIYNDDGKVDDEAAAKKRGVRLAWIRKKGDDSDPQKTIYVKGADFVEDDSDTEGGESIPAANVPKRDELLPVSFYSSLRNISPYNKDLLRKAIRARNIALLKQSKPPKQESYLENYYQKADTEIAAQEGKHFVLHRPSEPSEKRKRTHSASAAEPVESQEVDEAEEPGDKGGEVKVGKDHGGIDIICPVAIAPAFQTCVFGPTNVGKSYWAATTLMKSYEYYYPKNPIFVWSFFEHDPAYDNLQNVQYIKIDDSLIKDPPSPDEFENSLMVFDDIESLHGELREVVTKFRDQCLACGRKHTIAVIAIAHEIFGGFTTKSSILECGQLVLFNQGFIEPIEKLMRIKFGMSKDAIKFVLSSKTRWVMIGRNFPQVVITPREIKVI